MNLFSGRLCCVMIAFIVLGSSACYGESPSSGEVSRPVGGEITILALGDSITRGVRNGVTTDQTFTHLVEESLRETGWPVRVVNSGIGGEQAGQSLLRIVRELKTHQPDFVLIMYGTNDSYVDPGAEASRVRMSDFEHHLRQLVRHVRDSGAEPILMTEPSFAKSAAPNGLGEHGNVRLTAYMECVRRLSRELACPLVDHFAGWLAAERAGTDLADWTTDGYHPNPRGHRDLAERITQTLSSRRSTLWAMPWDTWQRRPAGFQPWASLPAKVGTAEVLAEVQPGAVYFREIKLNGSAELRFPRLDNIVRRAWWWPVGERTIAKTVREIAAREANSPELDEPFVPRANRMLKFSQTPTEWTIGLPTSEAVQGQPIVVVLEVEGVPTLAPAGGTTIAPGRDGVVTLPAHHAQVHGEKLQFEPLPHKNTVGYWVNPNDYATWRLEAVPAGTYRVAVFQGCGNGQGGSTASIGVRTLTADTNEPASEDSLVRFTIEETGHFQNFRWRDVGSLELSGTGLRELTIRCEKLAKFAVGDVRQIRLIPSQAAENELRDVHDVAPDAWLPPLTRGAPAPGSRLLRKAPGYETTQAYHTLYLPTDWSANRPFPVIVEWTGNGGYLDDRGDRCTGRPEDGRLGYGLAGSDGWICLSLPCLDDKGENPVRTWWGTAPEHRPESTIRYALAAVREACESFGGDPKRIVLAGFSRGSLACHALGLHDDEVAALWKGFVCFSHYDGVRAWPYLGSDRSSAARRLGRLNGRPELILAEGSAENGGQLSATLDYLAGTGLTVTPTSSITGFVNHSDAWAVRMGTSREFARDWLRRNVLE